MATETIDVSDEEAEAVDDMKALLFSPLVTAMLWIERTGAMQGRTLESMQRSMRFTGKRMSKIGIATSEGPTCALDVKAEVMNGWRAPWQALEKCRLENITGLASGFWSAEVVYREFRGVVPMGMVGIDLTEGKDSSMPTTNWEFHHCKHMVGWAIDQVRYYSDGIFIGSIVTMAPDGEWVPHCLQAYSFKVREIVPADRWDVWSGKRLVGRRMSPSDLRELCRTVRESVLRGMRHMKVFFPSVVHNFDAKSFDVELRCRRLWMRGEIQFGLRLERTEILESWVKANWLPSTKNASQFFFMRLLKDKLPCDVATTWTFSHWCQSDGLHALPAAGSTAWDLPLSRTRKPQ